MAPRKSAQAERRHSVYRNISARGQKLTDCENHRGLINEIGRTSVLFSAQGAPGFDMRLHFPLQTILRLPTRYQKGATHLYGAKG